VAGSKMTRAEQNRLKAALDAYVRAATVSESAAKAALGRTGIFTRTGKLSINYGGPKKSARKKAADVAPAGDPVAKKALTNT
jgi:hypothetical protein